MKRKLTILLSMVLALTMFVSCANNPESESAAPTADPADQEESSPTEETEPITIKFAGTIDPSIDERNKSNYQWVESSIEAYEAENPNVTVEYEIYKYDQIDTRLMSDYAAGIERGVSMISDSQLAEHYKVGDLLDLTPYFAEWDQSIQDDFNWLDDLSAFKNNDSLYALPVTMHVRVLAYRKDLFEQAGLDPEKPFETVDEFIEAAKLLTTDDVYGVGMYMGTERATCEVAFAPYLWMRGGELFDSETKMATFASPEGIETAQFLSDLLNVHKVTPEYMVSGGWSDMITGFINGEYAMLEGFGNFWFSALEAEGLATGISPPTVDGGSDTIGLMISPTGSSRYVNFWAAGVSASCENPQEATDFLRTLVEPENLVKYQNGLPPRQSMMGGEEYQTEMYQLMAEAAQLGRQMPVTPNFMNLADAVSAAVQESVIGGTDADITEILTRHQDEYNARYGGE